MTVPYRYPAGRNTSPQVPQVKDTGYIGSRDGSGESTRAKVLLMSLLSLILTFTVTLFVLFGPIYSSGAGVLQVMGYMPPGLLIPIAVAGVGLFHLRALKIIAAILMMFFAIIAGFSVGLLYFPVVVLMFIAAFRRSPAPEDAPPAPMSDDEFWNQRL